MENSIQYPATDWQSGAIAAKRTKPLTKINRQKIPLAKNSHKQLMILYTNPFELFKKIFYLTTSCPQANDQTFSFFSIIDPTDKELQYE